jgi:hypothetical protein
VIRPGHARRDFDFYATKDRAMAAAATVGLMLWDGQSRGTLMNVLRLADRNKPVVVYVQPRKGFVDVRTRGDLSALLAELDRETAKRLHAAAAAEGLGQGSLTSRPWGSDTGSRAGVCMLVRADGALRLADNTMVALALLIAESEPKQKELMIRLALSLLEDGK